MGLAASSPHIPASSLTQSKLRCTSHSVSNRTSSLGLLWQGGMAVEERKRERKPLMKAEEVSPTNGRACYSRWGYIQ